MDCNDALEWDEMDEQHQGEVHEGDSPNRGSNEDDNNLNRNIENDVASYNEGATPTNGNWYTVSNTFIEDDGPCCSHAAAASRVEAPPARTLYLESPAFDEYTMDVPPRGTIASTAHGMTWYMPMPVPHVWDRRVMAYHEAVRRQQYPPPLPTEIGYTPCYSRKVFVGGLPPDMHVEFIARTFRRFGKLDIDWPHKDELNMKYPPCGFAFLIYTNERSVRDLISACASDHGEMFITVSSPTCPDKAVQIRPWRLADAVYNSDMNVPTDSRRTIFIGGVPRLLKAFELALTINRAYGGVCSAVIDADHKTNYPKGAARVCFDNRNSYIAALSHRFLVLKYGTIRKRVEVKPFLVDDQLCDKCNADLGSFFCPRISCLLYFCEFCWVQKHSQHGYESHKPMMKSGTDRPTPPAPHKT